MKENRNVVPRSYKKCLDCLLHHPVDEHGMAFCTKLASIIYTGSIACPAYDDVRPF